MVLLDDCLAVLAARRLHDFVSKLSEPWRAVHISDEFPAAERQGTDAWAADCVARGWMIVTADRGKKDRRPTHSLPFICQRLNATHFRISATLMRGLVSERQAQLLIGLWTPMCQAFAARVGCKWTIMQTSDGAAVRLKCVDRR